MSTMISVALAALVGAVLLVAGLWRRAESERARLEAGLAQSNAERDTLSTQLARETTARKKQAEELATLRKKNDKARRREARAEKGGADRAVGTVARVADLEEQLERAERARDRGRTEREQLAAEVGRLEAQLAVRAASPPPVATPTPPPAPIATPEPELAGTVAELREQLAKSQEALEQAKVTEARMRKRMSNQEQLYASMRAELDVKKDRLRAQEERIQRLEALQVAISD